MIENSTTPFPPAADTWALMLDVLMRTSPERIKSLQKRRLTPNDSRALFALDRAGKPAAQLAQTLNCHPSTATWLIGRLVTLGYAQRRVCEEDRRVKIVALTRKGAATITALLSEYHRPPAAFAALTERELRTLDAIVRKLHANLRHAAPSEARNADGGT